MRLFYSIVLLACCVQVAFAQRAPNGSPAKEPIDWTTPFGSLASTVKADALVLIVITNDQPWQLSRKRLKESRDDSAFWCQEALEDAIDRLLGNRTTLADRFKFQSIRAGLPLELTGGKPKDSPPQAFVAICDAEYRLLSFVVGVPDALELESMVEDAEETDVLVRSARDDPQTVVERLSDRSRSRVGRLFRTALEESVASAQSDGDDENYADPETIRHQIRIVAQDIDPVYLLDAKLRFGFGDASDRVRLQVLEQHVETRQPWCELMLPFVAGVSLNDTWQPLVESIWGHPPITEGVGDAELIEWVQSLAESNSVVLMLNSPMKFDHVLWPPPTDPTDRRSVLWNKTHARAREHSFRSISVADTANLIRQLDFQPINIFEPTLVRYLFLRPQRREPFVVREGDPPSRFGGMLKRSKSTLVKK